MDNFPLHLVHLQFKLTLFTGEIGKKHVMHPFEKRLLLSIVEPPVIIAVRMEEENLRLLSANQQSGING